LCFFVFFVAMGGVFGCFSRSKPPPSQVDPFIRFVQAQRSGIEIAKRELNNGHKRSHWIWYVFPQLAALGVSSNAKYYGIADLHEARLYLNHDELRGNLIEVSQIAHDKVCTDGIPLNTLMGGSLDGLKLISSFTLFEIASEEDKDKCDEIRRAHNLFRTTLDRLEAVGHKRCRATLEQLQKK